MRNPVINAEIRVRDGESIDRAISRFTKLSAPAIKLAKHGSSSGKVVYGTSWNKGQNRKRGKIKGKRRVNIRKKKQKKNARKKARVVKGLERKWGDKE